MMEDKVIKALIAASELVKNSGLAFLPEEVKIVQVENYYLFENEKTGLIHLILHKENYEKMIEGL